MLGNGQQIRGGWQLGSKRTEESSDDFPGLDVEEPEENAVELVLGVEIITLADLGVRGMSCALIAAVADGQGMTNSSGRK
jgi:hypothetical protein